MSIITATTSIFVDDQQRALDFYVGTLGLELRAEFPAGEHRWITIGLREGAPAHDISLEPDDHPQAHALKTALREEGIPFFSLGVDDVTAEVARLREAGVTIVQEATELGPVTIAIVDDGCGNYVQLAQMMG